MSYTKEPGFLYIESAEDRRRHAPKLPTDEMWYSGSCIWDGVSNNGLFGEGVSYRRKLPDDGWITASTCLPDPNTPVWVSDGKEVSFYDATSPPSIILTNGWTHWKPMEIPKAPVSAEEVAFQKAQLEICRKYKEVGEGMIREMFLAGIEFQKGRR